MAKKNPFKKKSLVDTLVNVGIGGAANVLYDQVLGSTLDDAFKSSENPSMIKNIIKIVGGAVVGGMVSSQYARAAADGIAVVGVSNLVDDLMNEDKDKGKGTTTTTGDGTGALPFGTVAAVRPGNRVFKKRTTVNGLGQVMGMD